MPEGDVNEVLKAVARVGAQIEGLERRVTELRQEMRADTAALHQRISRTAREAPSKAEVQRLAAEHKALEAKVETLAVQGAGRAGESRGERNMRKALWTILGAVAGLASALAALRVIETGG